MKQLKPNSMVRVYSVNGSHVCMTFRKLKNGNYEVDKNSYDSGGYYRADYSNRIETDWDTIEGEINASQALVAKVAYLFIEAMEKQDKESKT